MATRRGVARLQTSLSANDLAALVGRFQKENVRLNRELRKIVKQFHENVNTTTAATAPVRSGYMSEHVETRFAADRLAAETGWFRDTFLTDAHLTRGKFYPPWAEFGQEHHPGQPSLGPAFQLHQPAFVSDVRNALQRFARRAGR